MVNLPNILSLLRLVAAPVLLLLAAAGRPTAYLLLLAAALLSDAGDGFLARRLGQTSELGARLGSWGGLRPGEVIRGRIAAHDDEGQAHPARPLRFRSLLIPGSYRMK